MAIFLDGFKEFNSTLMKTRIQIRSSSGYQRRLPVQAWKPTVKHEVQSISRSIPVNYRVSKTLERVLWIVKKNKNKIIKHRAQISKKREAYSSQHLIQNTRLIQASVQFKMRGLLKPAFNSKRDAYSS